jgi:hypothetical protein
MTTTVTQPSNDPTNKVTAITAALAAWGIFMSVGGLFLKNMAPEYYDPQVMLDVSAGVPTCVAFLVGWVRKDKPNVIITQEPQQ